MAQTNRHYAAQQVRQHPAVQVAPIALDDRPLAADPEDLSEKDGLVREIVESTRCIRRRTENREIHAILDEILWLVRSI